MPIVSFRGFVGDRDYRQSPGMIDGLLMATHPRVGRLEGMESNLRRETRRAIWVLSRGDLLTGQGCLEHQIVGIHFQDANLVKALPQEVVLLPNFRDLAMAALLLVFLYARRAR